MIFSFSLVLLLLLFLSYSIRVSTKVALKHVSGFFSLTMWSFIFIYLIKYSKIKRIWSFIGDVRITQMQP